MTVGNSNLLSLVRNLSSFSPELREEAAETICDWVRSFNQHEVGVVASLLSVAAAVESVPNCRESELNALGELTQTGFVEAEFLAPLWDIDRKELCRSAGDHFDHLAGEYLIPDLAPPPGQ
ncbi:hypothetical protein [Streptomyces purpureus]|uniref:Uncharacterized protein n=1 Tax=Streptomyces purpureus TaxID=1951 RepID=A0A918GZV8_9ACTN|nr:hypothetical protein [Streptomyces purpureus]GGT20323.1 hypothetical protein GCM10014713_11370 [Streptomyces purpureus]